MRFFFLSSEAPTRVLYSDGFWAAAGHPNPQAFDPTLLDAL